MKNEQIFRIHKHILRRLVKDTDLPRNIKTTQIQKKNVCLKVMFSYKMSMESGLGINTKSYMKYIYFHNKVPIARNRSDYIFAHFNVQIIGCQLLND